MREACDAEGLDANECDKFAEWALGPGWESKSQHIGNDLWNERHSTLFFVKDTDSKYSSYRLMIRKWKELGKPA